MKVITFGLVDPFEAEQKKKRAARKKNRKKPLSVEPTGARLYIGNLDYGVTDEELQSTFSKVGNVKEALVVKQGRTGRSKGFGFVEMSSVEEAKEAVRRLNDTDLNGRAMLDLQMRGPLALQSLSGTITPDAAQFSAPTLGIILNPISGVIQLANGAAQLDLRAPGNNGGTLGVTGRVGLASFEAGLTASLDRFGIRDPSLYDTSVTGAVQLTGPIGRNLLISGDLRVNETEIQVPTSGLSSLSDIPNIEHLGATRPVMRTIERAGLTNDAESNAGGGGGSTTRLDLLLTAPAQVFVRGRGLDAELGGSLRLTGPTSDIIPQGGFELIRGRLDILNQRFELDEGRIQLSGSFDPVLRFVAVTEANDIEVRIILDGPASAPDISFTSSPELPEDEVLAQLLFGRNLSNLSALQALELASAVAALAGGGAGGLLSDLRDSFGLDDLDVSEGADGGTAVRAGKYISENIYSDVVVESGGRTEINLNLDITTDITARGSVDNTGNSSLGIFFERDY